MKPCWFFMVLLSCGFSHATESQSICACKEQLKILCVPAGDSVAVPCPELIEHELTFYLFKDEEVIYNQETAPNCTTLHTREDVKLQVDAENKTVNFMLTGVNASSQGLYKCERVVMYPPPLKRVNSTVQVLVRVEGEQCKVRKKSPNICMKEPIREQKVDLLWVWILGLSLLLLYSLTVTITAFMFRAKWKRSDSQSDYMNTKPKAGRDRKKKGGVQIPFPRYL